MNAREVSLVLLFCLIGLLSIPLAIDPAQAWHEFSYTFIRCIVMFVVMVNVVRTEKRLNRVAAACTCNRHLVEPGSNQRLSPGIDDGRRLSRRMGQHRLGQPRRQVAGILSSGDASTAGKVAELHNQPRARLCASMGRILVSVP